MTAHPQNPKVTVLMPTWNAERTLAGAMESILTQTLADFEVVVVEDGSTDETPLILRNYRDRRVRVIQNEKNLGLTRSLELGLESARGRYIARMNAEDVSSPMRLERQLARLQADPQLGLVTCSATRIDARGAKVGERRTPTEGPSIQRRLRVENCIVHGAVMLRRDTLEALGGYDTTLEHAQDYDLWLRLSERFPVAALPDTLYASREREVPAEAESCMARVRLAARRRFADALVRAVCDHEVSAARAAQRVLELRREEDDLLGQAGKLARGLDPLLSRVPGLRDRYYRVTHLGALERVRRGLAPLESGWRSPLVAARELAECMDELAQHGGAAPPPN